MTPLPEPLAGLVRDHRYLEQLVAATRRSVSAATARDAAPAAVSGALDQARDLEAFLIDDLVVHIAKEEQVLFAAMRQRAEAAMQVTLDDMFAQHDEIRDHSAQVARALETLDAGHEEVEAATAELAESRRALAAAPGPGGFVRLGTILRILDSLLQGHFLDEEDNVFETAQAWFTPAELTAMANSMSALEPPA